ncbi:MAG: hypothetical protein V7749_14410 [Cocleimonas sp.]
MNVLFLTQYKDVFLHLSESKRFENVYIAGYSIAEDMFYKKAFRNIGVKCESLSLYNVASIDNSDVDYSEEFSRFESYVDLYRSNFKSIKLRRILKNQKLLRDAVSEKLVDLNIDCVVTWNGLNYLDGTILDVARELSIKTIYYEMGAFRPGYITIDSRGVNFDNSVSRKSDFYRSYESVSENQLESCDEGDSKKVIIDRKKFISTHYLYKVIDRLLYFINYKTIKNYSGVVKSNFKKNNYLFDCETVSLEGRLKEYDRVVFLPLQVPQDTQLLLNYTGDERQYKLLNDIRKSIVENDNKNKFKTLLVVKPHPLAKYNKIYFDNEFYSNVYFVKHLETKWLISNSDLVITINSTVGVEAIEANRPVLVLGSAYYAIQGIAHAWVSKKSTLSEAIDESIKESDPALQDKFISYLKEKYQPKINPDLVYSSRKSYHVEKFFEVLNDKS